MSISRAKRLISCYLTQHSCLRWSDSVVHYRNVFQVRQSTDRYMLVITAWEFRLLWYPHFVWSTDRECRSQRPRGIRRRSAAARPLRLWVRIPPGAWMFVCCDWYVLSMRGGDHSSRGMVPTVVRRCVWSRNHVNEDALVDWGLSRQKQTNKMREIISGSSYWPFILLFVLKTETQPFSETSVLRILTTYRVS